MSRRKYNVLYCALVVALGGFIFGLDAALISGTIKFVTTEFGLSELEVGTVVSAPGFGVLFALMITGHLCDRFGRRLTLLLISFTYIFSAIASVMATSFEALVFARFIGGLAFTSLSVAAMYIGEIAPSRLRGKLVSMIQINIVVGLSLAYFANYGLLALLGSDSELSQLMGINDKNIWRWMLGVEIIPAVVWFLLLTGIPHSPRWLMMKDKVDKAAVILNGFNKTTECEAELNDIRKSLASHVKNESFIASMKGLFEPNIRMAMLIAFTIAVVQQTTGINAIMFYAPTVFEQLGIGTDAAFFQATILGLVSIVFTVIAILLIDKVGRRPLVIYGLGLATVSLFACYLGFANAVYLLSPEVIQQLHQSLNIADISSLANVSFDNDVDFKDALEGLIGLSEAKVHESILLQSAVTIDATLIISGIIGFIAAFHFSIGPIMWVLFSEIFPTHIRGIAIPVFAFIASIVSYFVQQFFPWQLNNFGADLTFLMYACFGVIGFVMLYKIMPETKNKTIEEIEAYLSSKSFKKAIPKKAAIEL
ncbi:MFS transporter [Shewanella sp. 5_MG-2023]|uniref:MFS transporter n=1 Tax=Shewanella sp. 5_MG-2023 TaxID=3062656 RepID=UPI0026E1D08C|nr:MFS transporter [Shewanella sp. 5_MG-2023]MDO6641661.1 MFS transporter [Shewanella sp. 5_MG-2023]